MKKILFIGKTYAEDKGAWSGTIYQTIQGLKRAGYEVDYLKADRDYKETFWNKLMVTYWIRVPQLFGKQSRMDESFYEVFRYCNTFKRFDFTQYDIIFVDTYISIIYALPKNIKAKIVHLADATVDSLFNYYNEFSNLLFNNYWEAHIIGKRAFRRSDLLIVSSDWCKQNAIKQYGCNPDKIQVVEFGANLDMSDVPALPKRLDNKKHYNIYWSGVNWERKGGNIALECCEELLRQGYDISFNITGMKELPRECYQVDGKMKPFIHNYGFLSKNDKTSYNKLISIMREQDLFLFPSKAECSSIALCEANGFGLPCFVYDTGGTANYIENGKNGYMLPIESKGIDFAKRIILTIRNQELDALSEGAVRHYKEKLNWKVWSLRAKDVLDSLF